MITTNSRDMNYCMRAGENPLRYYDTNMFSMTYRIHAPKMSFRDMFESVARIVNADDIGDLCKMDSNTFHLSVSSQTAARLLDSTKSILIRDQVLPICNVGKQVISIKLHWLPAYIRDAFIADFSGYGKVLDITLESGVISADVTRRNGVRVLQLETDEVRKSKIPFAGGQSMLITFLGGSRCVFVVGPWGMWDVTASLSCLHVDPTPVLLCAAVISRMVLVVPVMLLVV